MKLDLWTTIIIIAAMILVLILYVGTQKGWFKPSMPELDLKEGGGSVDTGANGSVNTARYTNIAAALRSNLYGVNASDEGMEQAFNAIDSLNDNELRLVNNEYNRLYKNEQYYKTLRDLVNNEWVSCGEWYYFWYESDACIWRREILNRLNAIGA